jgi:hypothetical protein
VTFQEVLNILPDTLPFLRNVWIGGRLLKYGKEFKDVPIVFYIETEFEVPAEYKQYFSNLFAPSVITATASNQWKTQRPQIRLFNDGKLIVDRATGVFVEPPSPTKLSPTLTVEELKLRLPPSIPFTGTVWLTGSLARYGQTWNDADFIIFEKEDWIAQHGILKRMFEEALNGWKCDVGKAIMPEREPVFLFKLYEAGKCLLP